MRTKEGLIKSIILSLVYGVLLLFISRNDTFISIFVMTVSFFVVHRYIYDPSKEITSLTNIYCVIFFFFGIFFKYCYINIFDNDFMVFAPRPLTDTTYFREWTALAILVFSVVFALGSISARKYDLVWNNSKNNNQLRMERVYDTNRLWIWKFRLNGTPFPLTAA